jgi:hypothetical protein
MSYYDDDDFDDDVPRYYDDDDEITIPQTPQPMRPTRIVKVRIVIDGFCAMDEPYDEDHLRLFEALSCNGEEFIGQWAVKPEWLEILPD